MCCAKQHLATYTSVCFMTMNPAGSKESGKMKTYASSHGRFGGKTQLSVAIIARLSMKPWRSMPYRPAKSMSWCYAMHLCMHSEGCLVQSRAHGARGRSCRSCHGRRLCPSLSLQESFVHLTSSQTCLREVRLAVESHRRVLPQVMEAWMPWVRRKQLRHSVLTASLGDMPRRLAATGLFTVRQVSQVEESCARAETKAAFRSPSLNCSFS